MSVATYSDFGVSDVGAYEKYLFVYYAELQSKRSGFGRGEIPDGSRPESFGGFLEWTKVGFVGKTVAGCAKCESSESSRGGDVRVDSGGRVCDSTVLGSSESDGFGQSRGGSGRSSVGSERVDASAGELKRGKNYEKNKARRERAKGMRAEVRDLRGVCPSLTGSACTVDTRTAEEIEAARTLAARRVAENKVAKRMAELKLISLNNKDKTDAVLRLEAARMEQRINEAKAKSQASFKKCDTSLKSLGSTGSAGEFALKQEVKRGRDNEIRLKYAQLQNDYMIKHVPEHVRQVILDMPEPVFEHDAEVFGECPEDYDDEQRMAYDIEMNSRAAGVQY